MLGRRSSGPKEPAVVVKWDAFTLQPILTDGPVPGGLTCIAAPDEEQLVLGTADGQLLLYALRTEDADEDEPSHCTLRARRSIGTGRKPVEQLATAGQRTGAARPLIKRPRSRAAA